MFNNVYDGRRVLVTGHTGFKGSWLVRWLLGLGAEVAGYSLDPPTTPANFTLLGLESAMRDLRGDIRDRENVARAVLEWEPEVIFHLAAQPIVRESFRDPVGTVETNTLGTLYLLDAVRQCPSARVVICITSDKCYRNNEWVWGYRENDALGGSDPYSASKAAAEIVAHSFFNLLPPHVKAATVRAGNVVGGGDWAASRIVPDCARAFARGEAVTLRQPRSTRPWQHVLEPLSGYLWLGARLFEGDDPHLDRQAFNFGPPAEVVQTVLEVVQALQKEWPGFSYTVEEAANSGECGLLKLCCDKALARLGWHAALSFEETMRLTGAWYRAWKEDSADLGAFTDAQIAAYEKKAAQEGLAWTKRAYP